MIQIIDTTNSKTKGKSFEWLKKLFSEFETIESFLVFPEKAFLSVEVQGFISKTKQTFLFTSRNARKPQEEARTYAIICPPTTLCFAKKCAKRTFTSHVNRVWLPRTSETLASKFKFVVFSCLNLVSLKTLNCWDL